MDASNAGDDAGSTGNAAGGGASDANDDGDDGSAPGSCDGFLVGTHCVQQKYVSVVPKEPQGTDPDAGLIYAFDQTYQNNSKLLLDQPKIPPSADLGKWEMYNGNYVRIGVSYPSWVANGGPVSAADQAATAPRLSQDQVLSYNMNAATDITSGDNIASPNCTVCHSSYFKGKLVQGLGRNNHWIGSDASGFSLNVLGLGVDSLFTGDTGQQLNDGTSLLARLFQDATQHDHLFDIFAAFAMRHDPTTLMWTGNLDGNPDSGLKGWIDFPAWWHMKKKNALYANGSGRGYKSDHIMVMNWFSLNGTTEATQVLNNFIHVQKWIEDDVTPPKFTDFGGTVDTALAATGETVFNKNCSTCHGTYSDDPTKETYPNLLIDVAEVGTDPSLATNHWIYPVKAWYDASWYGQLKRSHIEKTNGYMPPPLDGVWITAPYFHNGSVPTLEGVLDSSKRPAQWTSNESDADYDWNAIGWQNTPGQTQAFSIVPVGGIALGGGTYDTTQPGDSNKGHTYGDMLTADQRRAVLEYLKTL